MAWPDGRRVLHRAAALLATAGLVAGLLPAFSASIVIAADTPDRAPDVTASPNGWTGGGNATDASDDAVYATATGDNVDQGFRDFSFGIPAGSIVNGITVKANAFSSDASGCQLSARLSWNDGASYSSRLTADLNGDPAAVVTLGSASNSWGHTWDPTQTTNGAFRLEIRNEDPGSSCSGTTSLDWVTATVTYHTIDAGTANPALGSDVCEAADLNFVIDMSGSIGAQGGNPSNLPDLKAGITGFVNAFQGAGGDGRYSGTRFNDNGASTLTSGYRSAATFTSAVDGLANPSGYTPTAAGIATGAGNNAGDRAGVPNVMFVVTDGSPNKPNSHGDDLNNPDTWLQAANAAVAAADDARAGSGASKYIVKAVYLSTPGDPGDTGLPFSSAGDSAWATKVMDEIGGGSHFNADFTGFVNDLFEAIGCEPPSLTIEKAADDGTVNAGQQIGFGITVHNAGGSAAHDVVISDDLPDTAGTAWTMDPAVAACSITGAPGDQALGCDFGTLAAGETKTVHVVSGTGSSCGIYDNTAKVSSSDAGNGQDGASVDVRCAHVAVKKVADDASVSAGDPIGFTITVTSNGDGPATGVTLTDALPGDPGLAWSIDGGDGAGDCGIVAGELGCDFGTLAKGATRTVHLSSPTTQATLATSPVHNTAVVTTTNDGSDQDSAEVAILAGSIDIEKVADDATVSAGDPVGFTITVKSTGPGATKGVSVADTLPADAGLSWSIDGGSAAADCDIVAGALTCSLGEMANGAVATVHISSPTTQATLATSPVTNTAVVTTTNDGSDQDTDEVAVLAGSIDIQKVADDATVSAGDPVGFTITVTSNGPGAAKGVALADQLPTDVGLSWAIDGGSAAADCEIVAGELDCDLGDMPKGASATVHVASPTTKATVATSPVTNTAIVTTTNDGSDEDTDEVEVLGASIQVDKVADDPSVSAGRPIGFTITVKSAGPGEAKGVSVTDALPTDAGLAWSIDGGSAAADCDIVAGTLTCSLGDLANGATRTVHIASPTTAATQLSSPVTNTAVVTTTNDGSDQDTDQVDVLGPDLVVDKTAVASPISAGDVAGFSITVTNLGPGTAFDVTLSDTLPGGLAWTTAAEGCTIDAGDLTCDLGTLGVGASRTMTVTAETTVQSCGTLPNTATAAGSNELADLRNNTDDATITVDCPRVVITKSAVQPEVSAGEPIGFEIQVTNTGAGSAYGVTVMDDLPVVAGGGWSIDDATSDDGWTIVDGTLSYGPATLAGGATVTVRVVSDTTADSCGTVSNTASVAYQGGSGSDDSSLVVDCPDVTIAKTAVETPILAGADAGFEISVWNLGPGTAYDVEISDQLPSGIDWTVDNDVCSISDGGLLTCKVGTLAENDEPFTVTVSGPTTAEACGDLDNLATVSASNEPGDSLGNNGDDATVEVLCASIELVKSAGAAADGATLTLDVPGDVVFTYQVTNTGTADLVNLSLVDDNATPADTGDDVDVTCPTSLAAGATMTCTATLPVDFGTRTNIATVTADSAVDREAEVSATDDAVVFVPEPVVTPTPHPTRTPRITPPPTSTLDPETPSSTGSGLLPVLLALAGIMLALGYLVPSPARSRRRNRRG